VSDSREYIPLPPPDLASRELPIVNYRSQDLTLYRCHRLDRPYGPVDFNFAPIADRFNAPDAEYGVLYVACDPFAAIIETFGASMVTTALALRTVSESDWQRRCLCQIRTSNDLRLVDLASGYGFSRLGMDVRISSTNQRNITRQWALRLWQHPEKPDGILYHSCHDQDRLSLVLFDEIGDILQSSCEQDILRDSKQLAALLEHYAIGLDPD